MNRLCLTLLSLVLVSTLILTGCASQAPVTKPAPVPAPVTAPTPASASAPAPAQKPAASAPVPAPAQPKVITLRYASHNPFDAWTPVECDGAWFKSIEKATNGRVKIEPYFAETLTKGVNAWEATKNGVTDIGWLFYGYWPGTTPLSDVITLPFLPYPDAQAGSAIIWQLCEKFPELQKEFASVFVPMRWTTESYHLITSKKQVKTIQDIKNMKIRAPGGPPTDALKALGAVPMLIAMPDCYLSLQKGVIDGMGTCFTATSMFRLYEVTKYFSYLPLFGTNFSMGVNWDKWNSLPPDIQKAIMSVSGLDGSALYGYNLDRSKEQLFKDMKKAGFSVTEYSLTSEDMAKFQDTVKPVWEAWVKKMEAEGRPKAREILNATLELIKNYKPFYPKS